jgi:hypothetical protein
MKVVYLARRRPGVDHDALVRFWREVNVADVAAALRPDRYVVTFFQPHPKRPEHSWDGMAVVWFDDEERGRAMTDGLPEAARRNGFADMLGDVVRFEADEHTFYERAGGQAGAPARGLKLTFLVVARPGVAPAKVKEHWVGVHGPAVAAPMAAIPGAVRYVASPALLESAPTDLPYVGVTELTYDGWDASGAHAAALGDDGFTALADNRIFLVGEELVVV